MISTASVLIAQARLPVRLHAIVSCQKRLPQSQKICDCGAACLCAVGLACDYRSGRAELERPGTADMLRFAGGIVTYRRCFDVSYRCRIARHSMLCLTVPRTHVSSVFHTTYRWTSLSTARMHHDALLLESSLGRFGIAAFLSMFAQPSSFAPPRRQRIGYRNAERGEMLDTRPYACHRVAGTRAQLQTPNRPHHCQVTWCLVCS